VTADPTLLYRLRDGIYAPDLLIAAVAELDLFTWVGEQGAVDATALADHFGLAAQPTDVMVTYLVALGLLARDGERLVPTDVARAQLTAGSAYDLRPYFASLRERPGCRELLSVLRSGRPAAWASASAGRDWSDRLDDPRFAERITAAMDARGAFLGPQLAIALQDLPARRVLDIGGGSGVYVAALASALPVTGAVLERPPVDGAARALITRRGLTDQIEVVTGDMFADPLPEGYDLHLFSHVLHDWDEDAVRVLLEASFAALAPGGHLVDHDVHVNAAKTGPLPAAEYSVFLMHTTPGKCWSTGELNTLLREVGFIPIGDRPTAADRSALVARKPVQ
jgi:SAM-dependent methyltransferase